jgi:hypothetical protein
MGKVDDQMQGHGVPFGGVHASRQTAATTPAQNGTESSRP